MPTDKQIEAGLSAAMEVINRGTAKNNSFSMRDAIHAALTAAEQAEPLRGQVLVDALSKGKAYLDANMKPRWKEQAEPAPAARSGAVKVVEDTYERYPKIMDRLADLDAAGFTIMSKEDVEAVRDQALEEAATMLDDGSYTMLVSEPWRNDGQPSKHDKCKHGATMYEDCIECAAAAIRSLKSGGRHAD